MPATINDLLQEKPKPVTARADEPLKDALAKMIEHDFSQLPVIDGNQKPIAMLTADSVTRALNSFDVAPQKLRVVDAMDEHSEKCSMDDDLLDVLGRLPHTDALLVTDGQEKLTGIITSYDTTQYFLRRAQDIMWVQDIEETLKEFILAAFKGEGGARDEEALLAAIEDITPSNKKKLEAPFRKALQRYQDLCGSAEHKPQEAHIKTAFDEHLFQKGKVEPFEKLSLGQYIDLFLHKDRWPRYEPVFKMETAAIRHLLVPVLNTRNDLAHFRTDISETQRAELRQCRAWLSRHADAIDEAFTPPAAASGQARAPGQDTSGTAQPVHTPSPNVGAPIPPVVSPPVIFESKGVEEQPPLEASVHPEESRYALLASLLDNQPPEVEQLVLTFTRIENLIKGKLPASAREHRAWWSNSLRGHAQARQWLDVGWQVSRVSMIGERVTFVRSRQERYADFFDAVSAALKKEALFSVNAQPSAGRSWFSIGRLPEDGPKISSIGFSFSRTQELRVELYLDAKDDEDPKWIFDALHSRKDLIEAEIGEALSWERLNDKRASRIAQYYQGSITDSEAELTSLREKAVRAMIRFYPVLKKHLSEVLRAPPESSTST